MAGFGNGSVTMENDLNADMTVRTVVYPKLTYHIKSLLHISYDVPRTMSGLHRKKEPILRFLVDIEGVEEENLYGYRIEMQFFGKVTLSDLLQNPPITSAALPEKSPLPVYSRERCVHQCHLPSLRSRVSQRTFSGNAASSSTIAKQRLLVQLLNTFGLWIWKFSSYVRCVDSSDLPLFVDEHARGFPFVSGGLF